jgi:putative transcriptional regulator
MNQKKVRPPLFKRLKKGLEEVILHAEGKIRLKTYVLEIAEPAPVVSRHDIVALRTQLGVTHVAFARLLNVPTSTLRAWEAGKRKPTGAAARLLQVYAGRPDVVAFVTNGRNGSKDEPRKSKARTRS